MYKTVILTIFTTLIFAQNSSNANPKPYSVLGDLIYENVQTIQKLQDLKGYEIFTEEIQKYVDEVKVAKEEGYKLEEGKTDITKKVYLNMLRKLSKTNDFYLRKIDDSFKSSMKSNDYNQFSQIVNNELIDVNSNKKEIIDYYYLHMFDINATGVVEDFLIEDSKLKALKDANRKKAKSRKTVEEKKIERIRANDIVAKKKLEKKLQKDLTQKKLEIRETQKKELAN